MLNTRRTMKTATTLTLFAACLIQLPMDAKTQANPQASSPQSAPAQSQPQPQPASSSMKISEANLRAVTMPAPPGLVIDGRFDDWAAIPVTINDPIDADSP